jgi:hypothetical protein
MKQLKVKEYIVIGRVFSPQHGYLATRQKSVVQAPNKTQAIKLAKQQMITCNDFEIIKEKSCDDCDMTISESEFYLAENGDTVCSHCFMERGGK